MTLLTHARRTLLFIVALVIVVPGCGPRSTKVRGKVLLNGQPLTAGVVEFRPDREKGNNSEERPWAMLDAEGYYELDVPLGSYRVTLSMTSPPVPPEKIIPLNEKYTDVNASPFSFEVATDAAEGAYDLTLDP
jgi:hypothetical protein